MAVEQGKIIFIKDNAPRLTAGEYTLEISQKVESKNPLIPIRTNNEFSDKKKFFISGERFNINLGNVDSVYPPANSVGRFEDTLPHLVFSNLSLPWIRKVQNPNDVKNLTPAEIDKDYPWLALFLFDEADPAPLLQKVKLGDLNKTRNNKIWFPENFKLQYGEKPEDQCAVIDVPVELFKKIAPTLDELWWLAHGRKLKPDNKIQNKEAKLSGQYSVIIGNRLPSKKAATTTKEETDAENATQRPRESKVFAVLLEGYSSILKNHAKLKGFHSVRLVTFKNWRFSCVTQPYSFGSLVENLDKGKDGKAQFIYPKSSTSQKKINSNLKQLASLGYVPMKHKLRQGYENPGFYRSPLVPSEVLFALDSPMLKKNVTASEYVKSNIASQDELYRFDPDLKMYDLSYASAWQLGQLLALQNKTFSTSLYNLKRKLSQEEIKLGEGAVLQKVFDTNLSKQKMGQTLVALKDDFETVFDTPAAEVEHPERIGNPFNRHEKVDRKTATVDLPKEITNFTEDIKKLDHVPFHYLIPHVDMLPMESIRLFQVDPNWIAALLEGAMSLGEFLANDKKIPSIWKNNNAENNYQRYGFLIRSEALTSWPGMEIFINPTFDNSPKFLKDTVIKNSLEFDRLERLAPNIAICIVKQPITSILFREPGEGLHFGLDVTVDGHDYKKILKAANPENINGKFKSAAHRTIDIKKLTEDFTAKMGNDFHSGDFGYQMIQGVESVLFKPAIT